MNKIEARRHTDTDRVRLAAGLPARTRWTRQGGRGTVRSTRGAGSSGWARWDLRDAPGCLRWARSHALRLPAPALSFGRGGFLGLMSHPRVNSVISGMLRHRRNSHGIEGITYLRPYGETARRRVWHFAEGQWKRWPRSGGSWQTRLMPRC